ncbi:MAG: FRG domain-containing protein, partial [Planctomycetes bacterium]|nr:FRG domain-containing protein [Planctomycetota bacterium]
MALGSSRRLRYRELIAESPPDLLMLVEGLYGQSFYFRGQLDASWPLSTSIEREYDDVMRLREESRILDEFKRRAHVHLDTVPDANDPLEWLAILQHHGAPTRLLDFTKNVYIAAFFAVAYRREERQTDAALWAVNSGVLKGASTAFVFKHRRALSRYEGTPGFNLSFGGDSVTILGREPEGDQTGGRRDYCSENIMSLAIRVGMSLPGVFPVQSQQMTRRMQVQRALSLAPIHLGASFQDNLCAI